jgi:hypothetical protein
MLALEEMQAPESESQFVLPASTGKSTAFSSETLAAWASQYGLGWSSTPRSKHAGARQQRAMHRKKKRK